MPWSRASCPASGEVDLLQPGVDRPSEAGDGSGVDRSERGELALVQLETSIEHRAQGGSGVFEKSATQAFVGRQQPDDLFDTALTHGISNSRHSRLKVRANSSEGSQSTHDAAFAQLG